jgi:hypothetical protein
MCRAGAAFLQRESDMATAADFQGLADWAEGPPDPATGKLPAVRAEVTLEWSGEDPFHYSLAGNLVCSPSSDTHPESFAGTLLDPGGGTVNVGFRVDADATGATITITGLPATQVPEVRMHAPIDVPIEIVPTVRTVPDLKFEMVTVGHALDVTVQLLTAYEAADPSVHRMDPGIAKEIRPWPDKATLGPRGLGLVG